MLSDSFAAYRAASQRVSTCLLHAYRPAALPAQSFVIGSIAERKTP